MLQHKLSNQWTVWNYYSSQSKERGPLNTQDYHKNLESVICIKDVPELSYFLNNCKLSDLSNYCADFEKLRAPKYTYLGENRKLEAISFFKDGIEPLWEYGDNGKGGQFFTTVQRDNKEFINTLYHNLIIQLAMNRFSMSKMILGARFVERTNLNKAEFLVKIEIWVNFNEMEKELIGSFTKQFAQFCSQIGWNVGGFQFKNNS